MADYLFCDTKAQGIRMIVGASTRDRVPVKRAINYSKRIDTGKIHLVFRGWRIERYLEFVTVLLSQFVSVNCMKSL